MKQVVLEAELRDVSKNLNVLKSSGRIPAVFYGKNEKPVTISVDAKKFMSLIEKEGANVIIELQLKDGVKTAIVKELQRHILTQAPNHIDFQAISMKDKIEVMVAIHTVGIPDGVKNFGGTMEHVIREIKVRCLPTNIPAKINVDVSALGIGQGITVADLPKLEDIEYVHETSSIVINVLAQKVEEEKPADAAVTAEAQAPEVISKGKKDLEGDAAAPAAKK
ncbi:MAG: 50S ribosomal protein L25 [Endomicrobiaceae bacterium]|nr:50S ribosomal protein L25 [Endomicrobiaceae bacterium]